MKLLEHLERRVLLSTYTVGAGGDFATLQAAANAAKAGDTVSVLPGSYAGFSQSASGTASAPIVWNAKPGAIVNGAPADRNGEIDVTGCSYVILNGFDIELNGSTATRAGIWGGGYVGADVSGLLIENNTVNGADWWGILFGHLDNSKIIVNTVSNTLVQHGIYVGNSSQDDVISGNTVFNSRGCGIQINADGSDGGVGTSAGMVVSDNRLYNNAEAIGAAINFDGVQNSIIENNLIYNAQRNGIALYQIDGAGPSSGDVIVNNTINLNGNGPSGWAAVQAIDGAVNTTILNNVLSGQEMSLEIDSSSQAGLVSDYNIFGASGIDPTGVGSSNNISFSAWQAFGHDSHSINVGSAVNSLFASAVAGDLHLAAGSAAIGAGTATDAPGTDFYGNARPTNGRYDIGAIQYQGTPAPTPTPPQAPTANGDSYSVQENQTMSVTAPGVLGNDTDPNGLSLSANLIRGPAHGTLTLNSNGSFVYTPNGGYVGADRFTYSATDGQASSSAAAVTINVIAPATAPVGTLPTAPLNLTAQSVQNYTAVQLNWKNTATNATSIQIERQDTRTGVWSIVATVPANTTSWLDTFRGVSNPWSAGFFYAVRAVNAVGVSPWSTRNWAWG